MAGKYPRGSEWRKWDLHIHTPESFHWNGGKRFPEMDDEEIALVNVLEGTRPAFESRDAKYEISKV